MGIGLLLDTHALLWWMWDNPLLSQPARAAIQDESNAVHVSAASVWEIATKHRIGKLHLNGELAEDLEASLLRQGFVPLPITLSHARTAGTLPGPHRDPFDRMLIAQAMEGDLLLLSNEATFDRYGVKRLW